MIIVKKKTKKIYIPVKHTESWCVQWVHKDGTPDVRLFETEGEANQLYRWLNNLHMRNVTKTFVVIGNK